MLLHLRLLRPLRLALALAVAMSSRECVPVSSQSAASDAGALYIRLVPAQIDFSNFLCISTGIDKGSCF